MTEKKNVRRFDLGQITNIERTPQGFLKVPGFATRVGIFPYMDGSGQVRRELRHPDDVFAPESLVTLKNAPVTNEHPPEMVTPENYDTYAVGYTTDRVEVNRDLVETDLIIADASAIKAVEQEGKRELSSGYLADLVEEEGVYNGVPYNYRQKNIRYNHVAIVDRGRAGPEVRLRMDSADAEMVSLEQPLAKQLTDAEGGVNEKIVISGEEVELPAHLAAVVRDMLDRYDEMRVKLSKLEEGMKKDAEQKDKKDVDVSQKGVGSKVPEEQGAPDGRGAAGKVGAGDQSGAAKAKGDDDEEEDKKDDDDKQDDDAEGGNAQAPAEMLKNELEHLKEQLSAATAKHDELQAKLDEMSSQSEGKEQHPAGGEGKMDSVSVRVRKRVKLERQAEKLVPAEVSAKFDSMSDDEVRAAVIKHRHPKADLGDKSSVYLQSRFDSIVETVSESEITRRDYGKSMLGERMDGSEMDPNAARRKMIEGTKTMWTSPLSANRK